MTQTNRLLLDVLGKALFDAPLTLPETVDWDELYDEAKAQTVVPLVFDVLDAAGMPDERKPRWLSLVFQYIQQNEKLLAEQQAILLLLQGHSIPSVILKGSSAAIHYSNPSLRVMGDIDILVAPHHQMGVVKLLQSNGYGAIVDDRHHCHMTIYKNGITVEVHKEPNGLFINEDSGIAERLDTFFADAVARRQMADDKPVLADDHQAVVLILHKLEHFLSGGLGLRQLCDWAVFVQRRLTPALWTSLEPLLTACGLRHFTDIITRACVEYLRLPCEKVPWAMAADKVLVDEVMERILTTGNFGVKDTDGYGQRFFTDAHSANRLTSLFKVALGACKHHWPVCERHPILLPIAPFVAYAKYIRLRMRGERSALRPVQLYKSSGAKQRLYKELKPFVVD